MSKKAEMWKAMGYPALLTSSDIATRNNVSRAVVNYWKKAYDFFPEEVMSVSNGKVPLYLKEDVEKFEDNKKKLDSKTYIRDPETGKFVKAEKEE